MLQIIFGVGFLIGLVTEFEEYTEDVMYHLDE